MYCQLGLDIHQLRQENRNLLHELESNSVQLENRIKKLRATARTAKQADGSRTEISLSPLKRKYESSKGQKLLSDNADPIAMFSDREKRSSPSKRSKQNITIMSRTRKKPHHVNCTPRTISPKLSSRGKAIKKNKCAVLKVKKPCPNCYCPDIYVEAINSDGEAKKGFKAKSKIYIDTKGCETRNCPSCCGYHKQTKSGQNNAKGKKYDHQLLDMEDLESAATSCPIAGSVLYPTPREPTPSPVRSLEDLRSEIDYSPESVFLRRMTKRAELDQKIYGDKNRTVMRAYSNSESDSENQPTGVTKRQSPMPRTIYNCSSKSCQKQSASSKKYPLRSSSTQTSLVDAMVPRYLKKGESPDHCCATLSSPICPCEACKYRVLRKYIGAGDEEDGCCVRDPEEAAWFDQLKHFRTDNWCDCHAHKPSLNKKAEELELGTDLFKLAPPSPKLRGLRRFMLDGKECLEPVVGDPKKWRRPLATSTAREESSHVPPMIFPKEVLLPSKYKSGETDTTHPDSNRKQTKTSKNIAKVKPKVRQPSNHEKVDKYKLPVPTNSFALRFQKGVV